MKQTKSAIRFTSNLKNRYLVDRNKRQVLLCHPLLSHIIRLNEEGVDLDQWIRDTRFDPTHIENLGWYSIKEIKYYYQKFLFLKNHGYFKPFNYNRRFDYRMKSGQILRSLANVRQVVFEVTDACNLKCEYCGYGKYYHDYDKRTGKKLDLRAAKNLLDYLQKLWNSDLNLSYGQRLVIGFYGGEPLLNFPFIRKIVKYVQNLEVPKHHFNFSMTTNAVLLEKHIDFLEAHKFNLLISLDGNRGHNSYRLFANGRESFDHIIRNIEALQKRYPDYFSNHVTFNSVYHNRSALDEIHSFFKTKFDKIPTIRELNTSGIKKERRAEFWETYGSIHEDFNRLEDPLSVMKDLFTTLPSIAGAERFIHQYTDSSFLDYKKMMSIDQDGKWLPTGTCFPFLRKLFVTVNKKILPCEKIGQQHCLGYAKPRRVEIDFERVAKLYETYFKKLTKFCKRCYGSDNCGKCLFNTRVEKATPRCDMFSTYEDSRNYFASHMSHLEQSPDIYSKILDEAVYA